MQFTFVFVGFIDKLTKEQKRLEQVMPELKQKASEQLPMETDEETDA
jgi:hypothetical protein